MKNIFTVFVTLFTFITPAFAGSLDEKVYNANCVICHGANGDGKTPVGMALNPKPADYSQIFNNKKLYPNAAVLKKHIIEILNNGKPGTPMSAFKTLSEKDKNDVADYLIGKYYTQHK